MIQAAIIEDDKGIRNTIAEYLSYQEAIECTHTYDNVEDFLALHPLVRAPLNVLLLDINLPNMSGLEAIPLIKKANPHLEIIMLTIHSSSEMVFQALCAGATGYLLKTTSLPDIAEAIQSHHAGGSAMSPSIARLVVSRFSPTTQLVPTSPADQQLVLTPREMQVLEALVDGLSYKLIAARLQMSVNTLPVHIRSIYKKLQINSKAEAIKMYYKHYRH